MKKILAPLGYLWALPHTIVGLLLLCTYYWPRKISWKQGCLEVIPKNVLIGGPWVGAQTHGWIIFLKDESQQARGDLAVHERVHVLQGMIGGPFYILAYGLHFLILWGFGLRTDWRSAYYKIWFEKQAYAYDAKYEIEKFNKKDVSGYWGDR